MSAPLVAVAPTKFARGFGPGREDAPEVYRVVELREALEAVYRTDAHLVAYVVDGAERQPRINKPGLATFGRSVRVHAFFCDVDNPGHADWTDEEFERARIVDTSTEALATAGIYYTEHGRRIVQPLEVPLAIEHAEIQLRAWLLGLERAGLAVDWMCRDWTRHFRLAHVRRKGRDARSRCIDLDRMRPIALAPIDAIAIDRAPASSPLPVRIAREARPPPPPIAWSSDVPRRWSTIVAPIASTIRDVAGAWHPLFLALAGALLMRGVPEEHVPALCRSISIATGADTRTADRERGARTTVERRCAHLPFAGQGALAREWPAVANALDVALGVAPAPNEVPPIAPAPSLVDTARELERVISDAPDGVTLIAAGCGVGKTRAAVKVAAKRAMKPYVTEGAEGKRAPPQSKTSISVDKHALAKQVVASLAAEGVAAKRLFGPLSMFRDDGKPECRYAEVAGALVEGGQSMQWELCKGRGVRPCEHFDSCGARDGAEGPKNARVVVGPHALVSALAAEAGTTGLLVIDEPPPIVETIVITAGDLEAARASRGAFESTYAAAMLPALDAVRAWLGRGVEDELTTVEGAVHCFAHEVAEDVLAAARRWSGPGDGDAVACARGAPLPDDGPSAPPLRFEQIELARRSVEHAQRLGAASRVFKAIHHALTSESPVAARIERRNGARVIVLMRAQEQLAKALRREGAVVVTDANAELHAPIYARVVGYERPVVRFEADDGAPIERTMIRLKSATRSVWQPEGKLVVATSLKTALTLAIAWARQDERARLLALITMPIVPVAIEAALSPGDAAIAGRWAKLGQEPSLLDDARQVLAPIVRAWPGQFMFAHYGATRGLDAMAGADALVTLGDPWINAGDAQHECVFLGVEDWETRYAALCRAELEQAQGRLRTVHRARPGRALHVGSVRPGGRGWARDDVRVVDAPTRVRQAGGAGAEDVAVAIARAGGVKALARELGCSPKMVRNYRERGGAIGLDRAAR